MKITRFTFLLFAFFVYDNLHHIGLSKNTYKAWSLSRSFISHGKRRSIVIAKAIFKFIKDKIDKSVATASSVFASVKTFVLKANPPISDFNNAARMCMMG